MNTEMKPLTPFTPGTAPSVRPANTDASAAPAAPADTVEAPRPSLLAAAGRGALNTGVAWAKDVGTVTAGVGGVSLMTLGLYGGVIGGALAGSIIGGGFAGPVAALLANGGGWSFLTTGLQTVSTAGKIGMVLGGVAGAAGGWRIGSAAGNLAGRPIPFVAGLVPGAVKGAMDHFAEKSGVPVARKPEEPGEERPEVPDKMRPALKFAGSVLGGGAFLAGLAGGGAIGAGVATGASLARGLIASNLNFTALAGSAAVGAAVGAAILGGICFVGGVTIVQGLHKGVQEVAYRFAQGRKLMELDKKDNLLDKAEADVKKAEQGLASEKAAAQKNQQERTDAVAQRDAGVAATRARTADLTTNEESLVVARNNELYDGKKKELSDFETFLDQRKAHSDSENARITQKEADVPGLTREEATRRRETHRAQNQGEYDRRKAGLENRESNLKGQEQRIPTTVQEMVEKELQPLRNERDRLLNEARNDRSEASRLEGQANADRIRVPIVVAEAASLRSRAHSVEGENSRLRSEVSSLRSEASSKESELSRCRAEKERREREQREAREREERERREREERDRSNHGGGGGGRDNSNYGHGQRDSSNHGHGQRERSRY